MDASKAVSSTALGLAGCIPERNRISIVRRLDQGPGTLSGDSARASAERKRKRRPKSQTKQTPDDRLPEGSPKKSLGPIDPVDIQKIRSDAERTEKPDVFLRSKRRKRAAAAHREQRISTAIAAEEKRLIGMLHSPDGFLSTSWKGGPTGARAATSSVVPAARAGGLRPRMSAARLRDSCAGGSPATLPRPARIGGPLDHIRVEIVLSPRKEEFFCATGST
jgi:hypothetical protein